MWCQRKFGNDNGIYAVIGRLKANKFKENLVMTLPGYGQGMSEKNYLFSNLRKKISTYHVFVQFDYRGHGDSYGDLGQVSISSLVSDTLEVLSVLTEEFKPKTIYLVGNGLGCIVAQKVALMFKSLVIPILVSPPLKRFPHSAKVFDPSALEILEKRAYIDAYNLIPGEDYIFNSDFNAEQYDYFKVLGSHLINLHGQNISQTILNELDSLEPMDLLAQLSDPFHIFLGEMDSESAQIVLNNKRAIFHPIPQVKYYYEHPSASDFIVNRVSQIIK